MFYSCLFVVSDEGDDEHVEITFYNMRKSSVSVTVCLSFLINIMACYHSILVQCPPNNLNCVMLFHIITLQQHKLFKLVLAS